MPVFNCAKYLSSSIRSILRQTFRDFQLVIIDDGSEDGGQDIIRGFQDPRIQLIQNQSNLGVAATLNKGLALSESEYIVRMDADDISKNNRLTCQLEAMEKDAGLDICGSWVKMITDNERSQVIRYPTKSSAIKPYILFNNPLAHPAVILRKSSLDRHDLRYDERIGAGQDYEFWSRCSDSCCIRNIPEVLLYWHRHSQGVTNRESGKSNNTAMSVQKRELIKLGITCDARRLKEHRKIGQCYNTQSIEQLEDALIWLNRIIIANNLRKQYDEKSLLQIIAMIWLQLCANSSANSIAVIRKYLSAPFYSFYTPRVAEVSLFFFRSFTTLFQSSRLPSMKL